MRHIVVLLAFLDFPGAAPGQTWPSKPILGKIVRASGAVVD